MKHLIAPVLLLCSSAYAEESAFSATIEVECSDSKMMHSFIQNEVHQTPQHIGTEKSRDGSVVYVVMWTNKKTKEFTITKTYVKDRVSCIVSVGKLSNAL